jgi:2-keto-4-pentenoate hydratase/2-oxohepta-3-ene-1,7-dioic acid hydratase in catechol pathway/NAD(P)-dependent dehydrogenase (short-subunit alcohol dehydrogenase family)
MVKLARIQTSSSANAGGQQSSVPTLLTAQITSLSFQSPEIQTYLSNNDIAPTAYHYINLSSIATTASTFLSMGETAIQKAKTLIEQAASVDATVTSPFTTNNVIFSNKVSRLLSPLDGPTEVGKLICIGMNYVDHCTEQNTPVPTAPVVFSKFGSCIIGPGDGIPRYGPPQEESVPSHGAINANLDTHPTVTSKLDYEVELGIVIGSTVPRFTSSEDAHKHIGGYTVIHDVSARDLQFEANGGQWLLGKCGDGYAPLGPVIATLDDFFKEDGKEDPFAGVGDLHIECRLVTQTKKEGKDASGVQVLQSSSTSNMIFSPPAIVSYLSKFMTLYPGDTIATGTPPGVGCFRKPEPLWLKNGDVVECEIEGIGVLSNVVVEEQEHSLGEKPESQTAGDNSSTVEAKKSDDAAAPSIAKGPPSQLNVSNDTVSNVGPQKQRLKNTVCIITGGARGLGYGIALRLAQEGASIVALLDMKKEELDEAASQLETELRMTLDGAPSSKRTFYGLVCDVTNLEQVTETFHHVATTLSPTKRIDILVQAAGVTGTTNILTHDPIQPANFDFVMDINIKGIFHGCHAVLPYMLKQNYGRIINIASIAGKEGNAGMLAYSTSKAAVIGLTKTVGKEYALDGITCNAIAPAVVWTKMVEMLPAAQVTYMTDKIPM